MWHTQKYIKTGITIIPNKTKLYFRKLIGTYFIIEILKMTKKDKV